MKDKINKKDYLVEKGEVLKGSSLLRKKDSNKKRILSCNFHGISHLSSSQLSMKLIILRE